MEGLPNRDISPLAFQDPPGPCGLTIDLLALRDVPQSSNACKIEEQLARMSREGKTAELEGSFR